MMRFCVGNTEIELSFWFFAIIALFAAVNADALLIYFMLPVVLHELGHFLAMAVCRIKIKAVKFTAFGVEIKKAGKYKLNKEIAVSLGGITANLALALGLYLFAFKSMRIMLLISVNLVIALFNLLPIGNLDGGEIAKTVSEYFFKPRLAYMLSRIFSFAALVPLFAAAIFLVLLPERNFTLLLISVYLLIDIMLKP